MKFSLLWLALCVAPAAMAQQVPPFPALPEASLTASSSTTTVRNEAGVHYEYRLVHLDNNRIWLAPAWHYQTKLEPSRYEAGEVDALLMKTLNEMATDGWELLEIRSVTQPVKAVQKLEKELKFNDPNTPVFTNTTTIDTSVQTRYLLRRALPRP